MTIRDRLCVAAALAVALGCAGLIPLFEGLGWLLPTLGAVGVVAGAAALSRRAELPRAVEPVAGLLALAAYTCLVFARPTLALGLLPGSDTLELLAGLLREATQDVEELAPPVPTRQGLVLLAVLGVGGIAVLVDLLAVTVRSVAAAGLPLLLLFAVPAAVLPGGLPWWAFVLGAAGWLGLLLADGSDTVSRWGTPLRAASSRSARTRSASADPSLGRVGRRIGAAALGVAVVLPALLPTLDNRLLGSGTGAGFGGSRSTKTYNPITELGGQLRQPEPGVLLLRYRTDDPQPDYLRMTTLDLFDGGRWESSELSADLQDDAVQEGIPQPSGSSRVEALPITTRINPARLDAPWLPTPFPPSRIDVEGPWLWDEESQTVFSTRTTLDDVEGSYTVEASRNTPTPELLRKATAAPRAVKEAYATPPEVSPYVADLVERTVEGATTDYDRVAALQQLFRDEANGFVYSEDPEVPGFKAPDALENFLRGKRGFCEQYASAMAAMVRSLGIPARVGVGFTPGSQQPDGTWHVTTSDAHAWPEVWFGGAGWVRFEPTPRSEQVTTPGYTIPPAEVVDPNTPSTPDTAAPGSPGAGGPAPSAGDRDRGGDLGGLSDSEDGFSGPVRALLWTLGAAAVLAAVPSVLTAWRRRRRWAEGGPLVAWDQLCDDATDVGHLWRPADSPRAAAAQLAAARSFDGPASEALDRLAMGAERARYARPQAAAPVVLTRTAAASGADLVASDDGPEDPELGVRSDVRTVRTALLAGADRTQRWRARLAPTSTLRWASTGAGDRTADLLDGFDTAVSVVGDRLKHPRAALRRRSVG